MSGETLSQSEIDFYIDGVRAGCRAACAALELFMLATHVHTVLVLGPACVPVTG